MQLDDDFKVVLPVSVCWDGRGGRVYSAVFILRRNAVRRYPCIVQTHAHVARYVYVT